MGKRQIVECQNKQERKQRRRQLGSLQQLVIKRSTELRYERAFRCFLQYLSGERQTLGATKERVDTQAQEFIEFLWEEGEGQSFAADVLSAIQHYQPSMRRCLNGSWRLIKTWQRYEIPARAPPITWQILQILMGFFHQQYQSPEVALGLGVAFRCLLRTGELLALQARDVVIPAGSHSAVLYLGETKTSPRYPHAGTVSCHDATLVDLLRMWKSTCDPEAFLVPWTQSRCRSAFSSALITLRLDHYQYKPYSLRRGGATDLWLTCRSYSQVAHTGRWSAERTVKVYIQDSIAFLTELTFQTSPIHTKFLHHWQEVTRSCVEPRRKSTKRGRGR